MSATISAATGWSTTTDSKRAGREASKGALLKLSAKPKLAVVFGSSWHDQAQLLEGVREALPRVSIVGESTAGEILSTGPISHSVVVLLLASDEIVCSVGLGERVDENPRAAGQRAAYTAIQGIKPDVPRIGFLLFGDGLVTSYADVVRGLQEVLGTSSLIVGGMAGDDLRFTQTHQYANHHVVSRSVAGAMFGGAVKIGAGMEHGFAPISKPRRITNAKANVLATLDGQPAASVYEEYFGADLVERMRQEGLTRQATVYPLGIQCASGNQWLLRNVVSFGENGSLSCTGEIIEGSWLQLMIGSRDLAIAAAHRAAQRAVRSLNQIACVIVFDSVVRRTLLGPQHAAAEIARIRDVVGASTPLVGCYTYGEQAPFGTTAAQEQAATQTGSVLVVAIGV